VKMIYRWSFTDKMCDSFIERYYCITIQAETSSLW